MAKLQDLYDIKDKAVPQLCRQGMPIVGRALESPFFNPFVVPAQLAAAKLRREDFLRLVRITELRGAPLAQAVWNKTIKEVEEGTMGGPFTAEAIQERYGPTYNLVPSFGLQQGVNEEGVNEEGKPIITQRATTIYLQKGGNGSRWQILTT